MSAPSLHSSGRISVLAPLNFQEKRHRRNTTLRELGLPASMETTETPITDRVGLILFSTLSILSSVLKVLPCKCDLELEFISFCSLRSCRMCGDPASYRGTCARTNLNPLLCRRYPADSNKPGSFNTCALCSVL